MAEKQREGIVVKPRLRLTEKQVGLVDATSRELLADPGLLSYSPEVTALFQKAGAKIEDAGDCRRIRISDRLIDDVLKTTPSKIVLGARNPDNRLILDAREPRVRFGTGSETNFWLEVSFQEGRPVFERRPGTIERLRKSAHLCEHLEHVDFFIRNVNIQDKEIHLENKDANKFFASLNNISKHVQAGITDIRAIDKIMKMGHIIAGGEKAFAENPVLSFITCVIKSPLQVVEDTGINLIEISRRRAPVVISSCPMGGATGPFDEFGMLAQINAELLAGIAINQLTAPGAPVLYGAVPVRTRLDNLNDMYGAPEFVHYNISCAQMARHYKIPCYSTCGVADVSEPGIQATAEKLLTYFTVPGGGAQYIHYTFGLLERTNVFCPEQAVMDNAHIGLAKFLFGEAQIDDAGKEKTLAMLRDVMQSDHKTFMYHLPLPTRDKVYPFYPLEDGGAGALHAAHREYKKIMGMERKQLPQSVREEIRKQVPGILPEAFK